MEGIAGSPIARKNLICLTCSISAERAQKKKRLRRKNYGRRSGFVSDSISRGGSRRVRKKALGKTTSSTPADPPTPEKKKRNCTIRKQQGGVVPSSRKNLLRIAGPRGPCSLLYCCGEKRDLENPSSPETVLPMGHLERRTVGKVKQEIER